MHTWEKLVKNALLGTERMTLQVELLPNIIKNALEKRTNDDAETLFLKAAALTMVYKKAGNIAPIIADAVPIVAPVEELPYCSPLASATWRKLQMVAPKNLFFVELWLDKLIYNQWIVSPELIVALLEIGASKKGVPLREKISAVVGMRGTWLVQFNEKWNYLLPTNDVTLFYEGKAAERLAALRRIRRLTPNMARVLLSETWAKESIKERKAFLEVFSIYFSEEDRPLVEQWKKDAQFHEFEPLLSIFQANETIEANLMSHFDLLHKSDWSNLPLYFAWSKDFSEFMLRQVYESFHYVYFTRGEALVQWVAHLHPEVKLEHIPMIEDRHEQKFQWAEYCSKNVAKAIDLRRLIAAF